MLKLVNSKNYLKKLTSGGSETESAGEFFSDKKQDAICFNTIAEISNPDLVVGRFENDSGGPFREHFPVLLYSLCSACAVSRVNLNHEAVSQTIGPGHVRFHFQ